MFCFLTSNKENWGLLKPINAVLRKTALSSEIADKNSWVEEMQGEASTLQEENRYSNLTDA